MRSDRRCSRARSPRCRLPWGRRWGAPSRPSRCSSTTTPTRVAHHPTQRAKSPRGRRTPERPRAVHTRPGRHSCRSSPKRTARSWPTRSGDRRATGPGPRAPTEPSAARWASSSRREHRPIRRRWIGRAAATFPIPSPRPIGTLCTLTDMPRSQVALGPMSCPNSVGAPVPFRDAEANTIGTTS